MMYALHDSDIQLKKQGAFPIDFITAKELNEQGYGIFFTPNSFNGARKKENLAKINFWIADIDDGEKTEQKRKIDALLLPPSCVVETKRGYHCYWKAKDATIEKYTIIEQGIINKLNADNGCKDVTRMLRFPGFYHLKDKSNPFPIKVVGSTEATYSEKEMAYYFHTPVKKKNYLYNENIDKSGFSNPDNWDKLFRLSSITNGNRNNEFARIILWLRDEKLTKEEIENIIWGINSRINPLPDSEVRTLLRSKI